MDFKYSRRFLVSLLFVSLATPLAGLARGPVTTTTTRSQKAHGPQGQTWRACVMIPKALQQSSQNRDERDQWRMNCLKKNIHSFNTRQCLNITRHMEYATHAEQTRQLCLFGLKKKLTVHDCLLVTPTMEFPDSGDEARWSCLLELSSSLNKKSCRALARDMKYPANQQRANFFCDNEIR